MQISDKCVNCEFFDDQSYIKSKCKYYEICYGDDEKIEVLINEFDVYKDTKIRFLIDNEKFSLNITLGDSYKCNGCEFAMECSSSSCVSSLTNGKEMLAFFKANSKLRNLIINVSKSFLEKYADKQITKKLLDVKNSHFISETKCLSETIFLAKEIFFSKNPSALFLKSKVFGILDNELKNIKSANFINISAIEKKMLENAQKIIEKNYTKPLSIKELSYKVGLNESKLKMLFKAFFGSTIHEFGTNIRMQKAKELIKNGDSIQSVANSLGFSATSNFSQAFKKHYGFSPSRLKD